MGQLVAARAKTSLPLLEFDGTATRAKTLLFLLLCACWLIPGLIGHDPWKPNEAHTFGVIYQMLKSGDWVLPRLAGDNYLVRPPLYYWTAALMAKWTEPALSLHDGARLASGFYMALTMLFSAWTGVVLFGERFGRITVLILIGSLGLFITAHALVADIALLAGSALALYGLAVSRKQPVRAGIMLGTGLGVGFLATGIPALLMIGVVCALLPLAVPAWRTRAYRICVLSALAASLPWLLIWPGALYQRSPQLFMEWFWLHEITKLASPSDSDFLRAFGYYMALLPWYAWPALPLAIGSLWQGGRALLGCAEMRMLLIVFAAQLLVLSSSAAAREVNAMPLLLPLTLIASGGIDGLKRGATSALDWFGMMTFGLLALLLWVGWLAMLTGVPQPLAKYLRDYVPGAELTFKRARVWLGTGIHCDLAGCHHAFAPVESACNCQLDSRPYHVLDTRHDVVVALPRRSEKLSRDDRPATERTACGIRLHR